MAALIVITMEIILDHRPLTALKGIYTEVKKKVCIHVHLFITMNIRFM